MKKRDLSAEEQAAWEEALRTARPLPGKKSACSPNTSAVPEGVTKHPDRISKGEDRKKIPPRISHRKSQPLSGHTVTPQAQTSKADRVQAPLVRDDFRLVDKATATKLRGGKMRIDARLDLHGLKASEAHHRTHHFISSAAARGDRTLLIITGKGKRGEGIIRRELPHWLEAPALRPFILAMTYARPEEGGEGAYRILLRRQKE
ncbi:MAG: Smr/MutS family protein [Alphaproteobacteria bacterium]